MGRTTMNSDVPGWLIQPLLSDNNSNHSSHFSIAGLSLHVESESPVARWVKEFLAPLDVQTTDEITRSWTVVVGENSGLMPRLADFLQRFRLKPTRVRLRHREVWQVSLNDCVSICFRPSQGMVWVIDRLTKRLNLVLSVRTEYPAREIALCLRSMIVAHLTDQNWHLFHAGAVEIDGKIHLVIGNGGAGKTSLITALMSKGARFIANERILLKFENGQVKCVPFPMEIAIGLGTAAQYPGLANFVRNPELMMSPTRRFSPAAIRNVDISEWYKLDGKIQLLASEMVGVLAAPEYLSGGVIAKVLLPNIGFNARYKAEPVDSWELQGVLRNNYIPQVWEMHYPNWLPLGFEEVTSSAAEELLSELSQLSACRIHFFDGHKVEYKP